MIRLFVMSLVASLFVLAIPAQAKAKKAKARPSNLNLSTNVRFDADSVYGRYAYADEALATVEDEKLLNTLLGVRTDFKDRLQLATKKR